MLVVLEGHSRWSGLCVVGTDPREGRWSAARRHLAKPCSGPSEFSRPLLDSNLGSYTFRPLGRSYAPGLHSRDPGSEAHEGARSGSLVRPNSRSTATTPTRHWPPSTLFLNQCSTTSANSSSFSVFALHDPPHRLHLSTLAHPNPTFPHRPLLPRPSAPTLRSTSRNPLPRSTREGSLRAVRRRRRRRGGEDRQVEGRRREMGRRERVVQGEGALGLGVCLTRPPLSSTSNSRVELDGPSTSFSSFALSCACLIMSFP